MWIAAIATALAFLVALVQSTTNTPVFLNDFFSNNTHHLLPALRDLKFLGKENLHVLEIGSYEGRSTRWFMEYVMTHDTALMVCIDTWKGSDEMRDNPQQVDRLYKRFIHNIFPYMDQIQLVRGNAMSMLFTDTVRSKEYDIIYIDADHYAQSALAQGVITWPLLKKGGLMIWDDYRWWYERCGPKFDDLYCPKQGVDMFLKLYSNELKVVFDNYQMGVQKI
ncbi:class I SAM-dependent methyltransferase [archaeon]|nr:MAG: class I SAM-dependent methyltransferase [archaeon]